MEGVMADTKILYIRHSGIDKTVFNPLSPNKVGKKLLFAMEAILKELSPEQRGMLLYTIGNLEVDSFQEAVALFRAIENFLSQIPEKPVEVQKAQERTEPKEESKEAELSKPQAESGEGEGSQEGQKTDVEVKIGNFKF